MRRNFEVSSVVEDTYYVLFFENMTLQKVVNLIQEDEFSDCYIGDHFTLVTSLCDNAAQFQKQMKDFRDDANIEVMPVVFQYINGELNETILSEEAIKHGTRV